MHFLSDTPCQNTQYLSPPTNSVPIYSFLPPKADSVFVLMNRKDGVVMARMWSGQTANQ